MPFLQWKSRDVAFHSIPAARRQVGLALQELTPRFNPRLIALPGVPRVAAKIAG